MSTDPKQILILGGGFAGVYTTRYLEKMLRPEEASITLINRENYWVYQPMLPEIISGSMIAALRDLDAWVTCPRMQLMAGRVAFETGDFG
jgi:NADH dehydrogenase FAD-containing subunit